MAEPGDPVLESAECSVEAFYCDGGLYDRIRDFYEANVATAAATDDCFNQFAEIFASELQSFATRPTAPATEGMEQSQSVMMALLQAGQDIAAFRAAMELLKAEQGIAVVGQPMPDEELGPVPEGGEFFADFAEEAEVVEDN
mmetsp:Transcript_69206/g.184432  ORF Transcript_69206/g.184432 Transcript_69206/m.184432 type:complete len:142 (+) Transcript_69206:18-443(+)